MARPRTRGLAVVHRSTGRVRDREGVRWGRVWRRSRGAAGCEKAIRRAIRKAVLRKLLPEVEKIYRDCARDDDLDRRYSLPALRLALKLLPDDLRDYTGCEKAIRRAIKKARKHQHGHGHHGPGHRERHRRPAAVRAP